MSKIPKVVKFDRSAAYLHHRAMLNRRENHTVDALELMRRAVEAQPNNSEYRLDLAELYCEMGCHRQSSRLLLDMLSEQDAPTECFYGLALNQLGMNDIQGARQSLSIYRQKDPAGDHSEDVNRLAEELDFYTFFRRTGSRRLNRAMSIANRGCDALRAGDAAKACRLFQKSLKMASEQCEMRALYAMALFMTGNESAARAQVERACSAFPPSVRALCVCAQVYHLLDEDEMAAALIDKANEERPGGMELRLLIFASGEMGLHARAAECARLALQETPYDRELLHSRAVALLKSGADISEAIRCWERILRLDPDDSVALYYRAAAGEGRLNVDEIEYGYEVPTDEWNRRVERFREALGTGAEGVHAQWCADADFRRLIRWAAQADDEWLSHAAVSVLATLDDDEARSALRTLMFAPDLPKGVKLQAAVLLKLQNRSLSEILPSPMDSVGEALVDAEAILSEMTVGDRQLVRYADEVLEREFGISAKPVLALMWQGYRHMRGMKGDPLKRVDAAAGALSLCYLLTAGEKPEIEKLPKAFGCPARQLEFYARRIADRLLPGFEKQEHES